MDSFMEKLAQKLTAQDVIKANAEAEAKELERLRMQVEAYKDCLDRLEKICQNLELSGEAGAGESEDVWKEQASVQMERLGKEALDAMVSKLEAFSRQMMEGQVNRMEILAQDVQERNKESLDLALSRSLAKHMQAMDTAAADQAQADEEAHSRDVERWQNMRDRLEGLLAEQKQQIQDLSARLEQDREQEPILAALAQLENVRNQDMERWQDMRDRLEGLLAEQKQQIQDLSARLEQGGGQEPILAALTRLENVQSRQQEQWQDMRDRLESGEGDGRERIQALSVQLEQMQAAQTEAMAAQQRIRQEEQKALLAKLEGADQEALRKLLGELADRLDENFHKENVKVYRNVQAAMVDQGEKQKNELLEAMSQQLQQYDKKQMGVRIAVLLAALFSLFNLGMLAAQWLGVF